MTIEELDENLTKALADFSETMRAQYEEGDQTTATKSDVARNVLCNARNEKAYHRLFKRKRLIYCSRFIRLLFIFAFNYNTTIAHTPR